MKAHRYTTINLLWEGNLVLEDRALCLPTKMAFIDHTDTSASLLTLLDQILPSSMHTQYAQKHSKFRWRDELLNVFWRYQTSDQST